MTDVFSLQLILRDAFAFPTTSKSAICRLLISTVPKMSADQFLRCFQLPSTPTIIGCGIFVRFSAAILLADAPIAI
jgi:hypothetical protein